MTALDVSPWVVETGDSPELAAFKAKVEEFAKKHSKNFHCGEYKSAMKELGIVSQRKIRVEVSTSIGLNTTVVVVPLVLHNRTEEEQKKAISDVIGPLKLVGSQSTEMELKIAPGVITDMVIRTPHPDEVQPLELMEPDPIDGYQWGYTSREGRIVHHFELRTGRARCRYDLVGYNRTDKASTVEPEERIFCTACLNGAMVPDEIRARVRENRR